MFNSIRTDKEPVHIRIVAHEDNIHNVIRVDHVKKNVTVKRYRA